MLYYYCSYIPILILFKHVMACIKIKIRLSAVFHLKIMTFEWGQNCAPVVRRMSLKKRHLTP